MKFRAHETFSIRKNWLAKGIKGINNKPDIFTAKDTGAMDYFGIGRNMVLSLRYWLRAVGIGTEEKNPNTKKTEMKFTQLGLLINNNDPYVQELGTLWLLQYKLACNADAATSWYFFFNEFNLTEFTREDFVVSIQNYAKMKESESDGKEKAPAGIRAYEDDFECIINTYISRFRTGTKVNDPEDNMDCPLAELGLIDIQNRGKKIYRKVIPPKQNIPILILLAVLTDKASLYPSKEIPLSDIQNNKCFASKVFNLDTITLMELLGELENAGCLKIIRTAGLDVIRINEKFSFISCVEKYYKGLNQ